ncbi:MAG: hypothetical protein M0R80_04370 [Proteobacteria bacterium]|jgi:hypothetical protein|nr:hypothetical protein [Pseudomonadota bacterium]
MTSTFNNQKFNVSVFNRGEGNYATSFDVITWNDKSYSDIQTNLVYNNINYEEISSDLQWNDLAITSEFLDNFKWINRETVESSSIMEWDGISYVSSDDSFKWGNRSFRRDLRFNQEKYNKSSFNRGTVFISAADIAKWNNRIFADISTNNLQWNNRIYTDSYAYSIKWLNRMYFSQDSILQWNNRIFLSEIPSILQWNSVSFDTSSNILKWKERMFLTVSSISQWNEVHYTPDSETTFLWLGAAGVVWPLNDYLSVKTIQGQYIFPDIVGGGISFKDGSIGEATFELNQFIPEDSQCVFYLKGSARMFDGISRRCVKGDQGIYKVTIQEYDEILKPENGKGGHYLVKNEWHDVKLSNLLSSDKPSLNDDEVGLLYMARSAIPDYLFVEHDVTNNIFKFEYDGIPYSITEVFEDHTLLTQKSSASDLVANSGWYHDAANKVLYIKCSDGVFPYYHVISVPYIWDYRIPVRIGNISSQADTVIAYWETANGDIPLDTIATLLTALNLEYEPVYRNGSLYIDISSKIGSGTTASPANYYREKDNIITVQEIDMADARHMINGVGFRGYGSGAGGVISGKHINMGRGGRFILLDDSSVHSQAMADGFVEKYLDDHYLPARSIKFSAPIFIGDAVDQRRLGDTAHISIPSEYLEQDLRVKEVAIKLKPLSQTLTFGDKLISYDDQIKAMRAASEKYRKHLQGEIEEFNFNWSENLDNGANRSEKFTITEDTLKIQKLELSCSTSLFKVDAMAGWNGGGGGGGDGGSETPGEKPRTGVGSAHTHTLTSGAVGAPSATLEVAAKSHTHTYSSTSGEPSGTTAVVSAVSQAASSTDCCTGVNCGKRFITAVGALTITSGTNVASSSHTHSISGTTSVPGSYSFVAAHDHVHTITALVLSNESTHTHEISSDGLNPTVATSPTAGVAVDPLTNEPAADSDDWLACPGTLYNTFFSAPGSDPSMYLTIKLSGPGITGTQEISGSPFSVHVNDSVGPVLIDDIVKSAGEFTVTIGLSNKDTPANDCHINYSMQISGQIFVDTIVKS